MKKIICSLLTIIAIDCYAKKAGKSNPGIDYQKEEKSDLIKAPVGKEFDQGSLVCLDNLTNEKIDNLELLGRVWGFLKYYHPEIAKGTYNWDYELFKFLPAYINAQSTSDRDQLIIDWISSIGNINEYKIGMPTDQNAWLKPDLAWLETQDEHLKNKLWQVYNNRATGDHYYIGLFPIVRNPEFKNENAYAAMPYPDVGYRLLALYRYWNMIHYFFPYKYFMDNDWNEKLKEYLPVFINAKDELSYELAALQLIGDIQDTHANIWEGADKLQQWRGDNYAPFHVRFIEDQLVVTDYYNEALAKETGLKIGDVITKVNEQSVKEIVQEQSRYYPASNQAARLRDMSIDLLRSNAGEIEIEYHSTDAKSRSKRLRLFPSDRLNIYHWYPKLQGKSYRMLAGNIGYITLQTIRDADIAAIKYSFKDTKGIIIDIRNYPATFVPFSLGSYFVAKPTPFVKFTKGNVENAGEFTFTKNLEIPVQQATYKGKLVVLVNEFSQSQAEYTAMAFRAGTNTKIVGSTTAGADGNVSAIMLPGGLKTAISGIGVYYPDGKETQRIGIVPDIEVKPSIEGIRNGKDELLEAAIKIIEQEK